MRSQILLAVVLLGVFLLAAETQSESTIPEKALNITPNTQSVDGSHETHHIDKRGAEFEQSFKGKGGGAKGGGKGGKCG